MDELKLVPDVIGKLPTGVVEVTCEGKYKVDRGNELTPTQAKNVPEVRFPVDPGQLHTLIITDPDAPSRQKPKMREWRHWTVVNVPGDRVSDGDTVAEYVGPGPPKGTGLHRYVFLVYRQPGKLTLDEPRLKSDSGANRGKFSSQEFAEKYSLGEPIAVNAFQAQWDDYVPKLHKQLGS